MVTLAKIVCSSWTARIGTPSVVVGTSPGQGKELEHTPDNNGVHASNGCDGATRLTDDDLAIRRVEGAFLELFPRCDADSRRALVPWVDGQVARIEWRKDGMFFELTSLVPAEQARIHEHGGATSSMSGGRALTESSGSGSREPDGKHTASSNLTANAANSGLFVIEVDGMPVNPGSSIPLSSAASLRFGDLQLWFLAQRGAEKRPLTRKRKLEMAGSASNTYSNSSPGRVSARARTSFSQQRVESVVEKLRQFKDAWPFLEPVDPVALNIPDYTTIITSPMDLGTIRRNVYAGNYLDADSIREDIQLVWDNAKLFNPEGDPIHNLAVAMERRFWKLWELYEAREAAAAASAAGAAATTTASAAGNVFSHVPAPVKSESAAPAPPATSAAFMDSKADAAFTRALLVRRDVAAEEDFINRFGLWEDSSADVAEVGAIVERRDGSARVVRKSTPASLPPGSKYYKPSPVDAQGIPIMPIQTKHLTVHSLGKIVTRNGFHNKRYLWPVGFRSEREGASYKRIGSRVMYTQEILDGGREPLFRVTAQDDPDNPVEFVSATGAWREVMERVTSAGGSAPRGSSGPEQYGFVHPNILFYIQQLPGAESCYKYDPIRFVPKE